MADKKYDVVIVGAGPAGLTAAIYTSRRALRTLVISKDVGGRMAWTDNIANYPGFLQIGGLELGEKFKEQAEKIGTEFLFTEAKALTKIKDGWSVKVEGQKDILTTAVILCFGLIARTLNVPGEKELIGKGVAYCATCDGPLYRDKVVTVVGAGNSALEAALYLTQLAKQVYVINNGDKFSGEQILVDKLQATKNAEIFFKTQIKAIKGENKVTGFIYNNGVGQDKELLTDGIFIEIGYMVKADWLAGLVKLNAQQEIIISRDGETNQPGIFAAGDITDSPYKQIVISAGEGATAALQAQNFIQNSSIKKG
jgi:thioredoxin reductase (NADPH)